MDSTRPETPASSSRLLRVFLVATLLPGAIVLVDHLSLDLSARYHWSTPTLLAVYGLFVAQVALLGFVVGRFIDRWFLRWTVLVWGLLLIDSFLFTMMRTDVGDFDSTACLAYALVSGQFSLLAIWGVLGPLPWPWRLPAVIVAVLVGVHFTVSMDRGYEVWALLLLIQCAAFAGLCVVAWCLGFQIESVTQTTETNDDSPGPRGCQFSIRHMLFWATAMVPLMLLIQALDFWFLEFLNTAFLLPLAMAGVLLSVVSLVATWAALGKTHAAIRISVLGLFPPMAGVVLAIAMLTLGNMTLGNMGRTTSMSWPYYLMNGLVQIRSWWIAWTVLSAWFLAGLLLMFRAGGYRLVRRRNRTPSGSVTPENGS